VRAQPSGIGARTYTLGVSVVRSGELGPLGEKIVQGAELAVLQRNRTDLRHLGLTIRVRALDDAVNGVYSGAKDAANARTLIADPTVFAEDGPYNSGAAAASMPVYNRADLVQVSPGNTLPDLTDPANRAHYEPATAAGMHGITYFRVCTTDAFQGPAGARYARQHFHIRTGYVVNDQGLPGIGLANAYRSALPRLGVTVLGRSGLNRALPSYGTAAIVARIKTLKPDAVFFGGDPETGGTVFADKLRGAGVNVPLIGGDALLSSTWIVSTSGMYHPGSRNSWLTAIGPNPTRDPRDRGYATLYRSVFHTDPTTGFSVLSFDAANIEIDALVKALTSGRRPATLADLREAVRANVAAAHYRGIGGAGHFDANGDTTNHVISMWRVSGRTAHSHQWLGYAPGFSPHRTP